MHGDKITSQKLTEMSEKHKHMEQFLKDMSQKQEINEFSEESQQFFVDMNDTEIFKLYENSANINVFIAMPFPKSGSFIAVAGEILKYSRSFYNIPEDQLRFYFNLWICH